MRTNRIEALSDGIFAIVMTLLVLELKVPHLQNNSNGELLRYLLSLSPVFISYVISFIILGIYWVGHHNQMHFIKKSDRTFLWLNLMFFMFVSLVPFSAALLGEFHTDQISVIIYGLNLSFCGLSLFFIWRHAILAKLTEEDISQDFINMVNTRILTTPVICLLAIGVSFINVSASLVLLAVPIIFYILPGRLDKLLK